MSNAFCVNKTGITIPVYSDRNGSTQIGTISNREAFGYNANWGGDGAINLIRFKSAAGPVRDGFIINPPNGAMTECTDYPYGTVVINGETFSPLLCVGHLQFIVPTKLLGEALLQTAELHAEQRWRGILSLSGRELTM